MSLSASIFRRGGPKKELFDIVNEDVDDEKELNDKLAELDGLLHLDKTGRELSAALWRPFMCAAELVKSRKQCSRDMGFIRGRKAYLHVEEAVYLIDRGDLLLFVEEPEEQPKQQQGVTAAVAAGSSATADAAEYADAGGGDVGGHEAAEAVTEATEAKADDAFGLGWRQQRRQQRQRLLSVQEAFDLMISLGVPLERYLLYSSLNRSGYLVMRHPSRWLLGREQQPEQVWGNGAWASCYGRAPAVPGTIPPQPMQQQLVAASAAAAATATAAATSLVAATGNAAASVAASQMDVDSPAAAACTSTERQQGAEGKLQQQLLHRPPQRRRQAAAAADAATAATAAAGCRGWWRVAEPGHPHLQGVPEEYFRQQAPAAVADRLSKSLRASFPNLQPLETIGSVLAAPSPATRPSVSAPNTTTRHDGGDGVRVGGRGEVVPAAGASADAAAAGSGGGSGSGSGCIFLGTPGSNAHLAFDVYKPGSFVSRYKGHFPAVHTHVAMCSAAPPTLGEMRAADAAAAAAAAGEAGRPASVSWATVLNGDITLFSIGEADLLCLL